MGEETWDIGDGYQRWVLGISQPRFLVALVKENVLAYVVGSHIKFARLANPVSEIIRVCHPECEGISILEGNPVEGVFAVAEVSIKPRILVYKFEKNTEVLSAQIRGCAGTEIRAVRFMSKNLLITLTGAPEFTISVWKWALEEVVVAVSCFNCTSLYSDLHISSLDFHFWVEWGPHHMAFYELQSFTETDVIRYEISIPLNEAADFVPDHRLGSKFAFDIISGVWSTEGNFYVLDEYRTIYQLKIEHKTLIQIGEIPYEKDHFIYKIVPYDGFLGALADDGTFLVLKPKNETTIKIKGKFKFTSNFMVFIPNLTALSPNTSFYGITEIDKKVECIMNGRIRAGYNLPDFVLSEISTYCFIEPKSEHLAVVTEKGIVYILETQTGNVFCRWRLNYFVCSIITHPLFNYVIIGTMDGCAYFLNISDMKSPTVFFRSYFHGEASIDSLDFMCRGRLLLAADSRLGLMFLQFAIPSMDFEFLDHVNVEGSIRCINTPSSYKDKRFQVLVQRDRSDEIALVVNNYRVDGDCFEIVASQYLDCSITTMCFSNYKKMMYVYSAENGMGGIPFTEDMNAGSLKEPETRYDCQLALEVNRAKMIGNVLYTFAQDGYVCMHEPPSPKAHAIETFQAFKTHFSSYEGIKDGVVSLNGCHMITYGNDNTLVHIQLKESGSVDWNALHYGTPTDIRRMLQQQLGYFAEITRSWSPLGDYDKSLSTLLIEETEFYEIRSTEEEVSAILGGIEEIRQKVKSLMTLNDSYEDFEKVPLEEFELDEEEEEESQLDFEQNRKMTEALVVSICEEREEWADGMKEFLYDQFKIKSCTLKGFNYDKEVTNYPLLPLSELATETAQNVFEERRLEKKLQKCKKEIIKLQKTHIAEVKAFRKASKKRRPKKKIDLSRFPPAMRDEMKHLFEDLATPPSNSDSSVEDNSKSVLDEDLGYFERLLKKQSQIESEMEKPPEAVDKKKHENDMAGLFADLDDDEPVYDGEEEDEEEEEDDDEEESEEDDEVEIEHDGLSSAGGDKENIHSSDSFNSSPRESKTKQKNRIFFGRPSRQALEAIGISAKDAEVIDARAEKMAQAQQEAMAQKAEAAKVNRQKEMSEMRKTEMEQAVVKKIENPVNIVTSPKSPFSDDDVEEEELYDDGGERPKRKRIRVKKRVVVNEVEIEEWVTTDGSSAESEEDNAKETYMEKAIEEYKNKYMSQTQLTRNEFIKRLESGSRVWNFYETKYTYYPQMELWSLQQCVHQIDMIRSDLRQLQNIFNSEFEIVRRLKDLNVKSIETRNARIREIADYLNLELDIVDPEHNIWEYTETIFNVTNEEIPMSPYLTLAEREELERLRLEEEARRLAKSEDFREKSLIVMMDGVLESRREDILKKDVPKPRFMLVKEQWEWNFEDYRRADDYYELVEQLEQLRDEFKKELEIEIRQLIKLNSDCKNLFDKRLSQLYTFKLSIEQAVRLEELKIVRLMKQLTRRDYYQRKEDSQNLVLRKLQERMKSAKSLAAQINARVAVTAEQYEEIVEKERTMISEFRGNILEAGVYLDTFSRMFRKSPRLLVKQDRMQELLVLMIKGLDSANLRWFAHEHGEMGQIVADAIFEMDEAIQIPVGCPRAIWDKFTKMRRQRCIAEFEARVAGTELIQLRNVTVECKKREDEIAQEMAQVLALLSGQKNLKLYHIQNGEMQLVVPQGRIEAEITRANDFSDIAICRTGVVLKLNSFIRTYTQTLVTQLLKSKVQHRQIMQIDWKYRKINLREQHLLAKRNDIATLRVTKEVLEFLRLHNDFRSMQDQRLIRIKKLQEYAEIFHSRHMEGMGKLQRLVQAGVTRFEKDSLRKEKRLDKRNIRYNTLKVKCNIDNPEMIEAKRAERMQLIMRCGHMVRLYSQFEETIVTLERELERLYDKTYPYL